MSVIASCLGHRGFQVITWLSVISSHMLAHAAGSPNLGGDPERGQEIYQQCIGCHSLERNRTGPRHCGLIGRRAGSVPVFPYSTAMQSMDIIWTREQLDTFLTSPTTMVPGTSMGYAGISDPGKRRDLIAYIEFASQSKANCGQSKN